MAAKDDAGGVSAPEAAVAGDLHAAPREAGIGDASAAGVAGASASASPSEGGGVSAGQAGESKRPAGGVSRRGFVLGSAGGAAMLALGLVKFAPQTALVRPPGGQDADRLLGMCIRCGKCMEVCPNGVIAPAHIEDKDLCAMVAEMVRFNARVYPSATPLRYFRRSPYDLTQEAIEQTWQSMQGKPEYADIEELTNNQNERFLFSTQHLTRRYAKAISDVDEWTD